MGLATRTIAFLAVLLAACSGTQSRRPLDASGRSGASQATGRVRSWHFALFADVPPDEEVRSVERATRAALEGSGSAALEGAMVERDCSYFPSADVSLWARCTTTVTGRPAGAPKAHWAVDSASLASAGSGDLRDAIGAAYPPAGRGEAAYRRLLALEPQDARMSAMILTLREREEIMDHIVRSKGREAYWSWKFEVSRSLPPQERDFVQWFLLSYSPYRPAPD